MLLKSFIISVSSQQPSPYLNICTCWPITGLLLYVDIMLILKDCKWWAPLNLVASGHQEKLLSSSFSFLEESAFEICLFDGERQKWLLECWGKYCGGDISWRGKGVEKLVFSKSVNFQKVASSLSFTFSHFVLYLLHCFQPCKIYKRLYFLWRSRFWQCFKHYLV